MNLLPVFEAMMAERNVTRAGRRLHLSQSATSGAVQRLRDALGDELFIRTAKGMHPTPRALELAGPVAEALDSLRGALDDAPFDPATEERTLTVAASDYDVTLHIPALVLRLSKLAPGVDLRILPHTNVDGPDLVDSGRADLVLGWFPRAPQRLHVQTLYEEHHVVAMRADHPLSNDALTLEGFAKAPHLLVTLRSDATGMVDDHLREHGLERRVALTIPNFTAAPNILANTEMIATLPARVAARGARACGLVTRHPPFDPYTTPHQMMWHPRTHSSPAHVWLRDTVARTLSAL